MLLVHQAGSVKVGEVVRYTLTYTPSLDRILPTPPHLHVKVKNTCAIPLRAAWVHGPYALHVAAYPASFDPHRKADGSQPRDGVPQYEPMLKAGGSWQADLRVPEHVRETGADLGKRRDGHSREIDGDEAAGSVTWIIEVASQILFSNSAAVHFEVLVGRDERSLDLGFAAVAGHGHGGPGQIKEKNTERERARARRSGSLQTAGVYSKAIKLVAEDTETLWDKPPLPSWEDGERRERQSTDARRQPSNVSSTGEKPRKRRRVHLVIVSHGMHSNTGADMLFLKESIDATVAQARVDAKRRKGGARNKPQAPSNSQSAESGENDVQPNEPSSTAPLSGGQNDVNESAYDSDDDEQTIVRGFTGNAVKTENGIQYLGKRLAKYILRFTYPDQPFLPVKKGISRALTDTFKSGPDKSKRDGPPAHSGSSIHHPDNVSAEDLPYKFTSISFVGHSLGGLIQTYAVAYIHKHNPDFFEHIKPVNFICMASPMLGLSNENPMYIKFALDFGLVGRTGQDLGLTWRAPTLAKGGWNAMIGGLGAGNKKEDKKKEDPGAKPLLRILPTGPAHQVLKKFRNRTVYSNVVNDGIVPLRTSCLLFLDWRGLGRVDKARRENGLIGTVAEWGWAELTGANSSAPRERIAAESNGHDDEDDDDHTRGEEGATVPQPDEDETGVDNRKLYTRASYDETSAPQVPDESERSTSSGKSEQVDKGMLGNLLHFFRSSSSDSAKSPASTSKKTTKALRRGQTIARGEDDETDETEDELKRGRSGTTSNPTMRPHLPRLHRSQNDQERPGATRGDSYVDEDTGEPQAPPKTSIFESAGDILHPPLPSRRWITDPSSRARTIFHDRIYHPEDIPPPPERKKSKTLRPSPSDLSTNSTQSASSDSKLSTISHDTSSTGGMKVEEKIARAYHRDLTWRKVLVRLEPDAHNNMIVRRMFANAYGWPVIKHLCDTHFADTVSARTRDDESSCGRAHDINSAAPADSGPQEVEGQTDDTARQRSTSEVREAQDEVADLEVPAHGAAGSYSSQRAPLGRQNSAVWDDSYFEGSDDEDSDDVDERFFVQKFLNPHAPRKPEPSYNAQPRVRPQASGSHGAPVTPRSPDSPHALMEGHRGLSPATPRSPTSMKGAASQQSTFDAANVEAPIIANRLVQEPAHLESPRNASSAAMGLRKTVEAQTKPATPAGRK